MKMNITELAEQILSAEHNESGDRWTANEIKLAYGVLEYVAMFQRLDELDYALSAGNTADQDIPRATLENWLRYVRTGQLEAEVSTQVDVLSSTGGK